MFRFLQAKCNSPTWVAPSNCWRRRWLKRLAADTGWHQKDGGERTSGGEFRDCICRIKTAYTPPQFHEFVYYRSTVDQRVGAGAWTGHGHAVRRWPQTERAGTRARPTRALSILCAEDNPYGRVVMNTILTELG